MGFVFKLYGNTSTNTYAVNGRISGVLQWDVAKLNWAIPTPTLPHVHLRAKAYDNFDKLIDDVLQSEEMLPLIDWTLHYLHLIL